MSDRRPGLPEGQVYALEWVKPLFSAFSDAFHTRSTNPCCYVVEEDRTTFRFRTEPQEVNWRHADHAGASQSGPSVFVPSTEQKPTIRGFWIGSSGAPFQCSESVHTFGERCR